MGVGHQHIVDAVCRKGELGVGDLVPALLQSAVHQNALTVHFQAVTAAGHALIGAEKAELHESSSLSDFVWICFFNMIVAYPAQKYN